MEINNIYLLMNINRIGHMLMEPYFAFYSGVVPEDTVILYPADREIANQALFRILCRHFEFRSSPDFYQIGKADKVVGGDGREYVKYGWNLDIFPRIYFQRLNAGQLTPRYYSLNEEEEEEGRRIQDRLGLPEDARWVCLHSREPGYVSFLPYHSYRDATIQNFYPVIDYLLEEGYWVVRIGDKSMTPLPKLPRVIDLPHTDGVGSDLADLWFILKCEFMIGNTSGPQIAPGLFNGPPRLWVNFVPHGAPPYKNHPQDRYISKLIRLKRRGGRYLTLWEAMYLDFRLNMDEHFQKFGMEVIEHSPEDLLDAVQEMVEDLRSGAPPDPSSDPILARYWELAAQSHDLKSLDGGYDKCYLWGPSVGRRFLNKYPELLE